MPNRREKQKKEGEEEGRGENKNGSPIETTLRWGRAVSFWTVVFAA